MSEDSLEIGNNIVACNGKLVCGVRQQLPLLIIVSVFGSILLLFWGIFVMPLFLEEKIFYFPIASNSL